jgi:hypothetical protein
MSGKSGHKENFFNIMPEHMIPDTIENLQQQQKHQIIKAIRQVKFNFRQPAGYSGKVGSILTGIFSLTMHHEYLVVF